MVRTSSVLAVPGTPVIRQWPPTNSAMSICSSTSSWPTMTLFHLADDFGIHLTEARNSGLQNVGIDLWSGHGDYGVFPSSPLTSSSSFWAGLYSGAASSAVMASSLALSV